MISVTILLLLVVLAGSSGLFGWRNIYYRLLRRDLETWQRHGWVSEDGAAAILAANRPQGIGNRLVFLVALLGALLMLFSVFSFVAANWDEMSRLARLTWLVAVLWMAYLAGWRLAANGLALFAEAAFALGVGIFGANIALIAQMFHIEGHPPSAVLMWTLGALGTAALLNSRAALALAFVGVTAWSLMEMFGYDWLFHWPFLLVWATAVFLALQQRWWYAYHLALLSLLLFLVPTLISLGIEAQWSAQGILAVLVMLSLLLLAAALWLQGRSDGGANLEHFDLWLEKYGLVGLLLSLFVLQTLPQNLGLAELDRFDARLVEAPLIGGPHGWLVPTLALAAAALAVLASVRSARLLLGRELAVLVAMTAGVVAFAWFGTSPSLSAENYHFLATWLYGAAFLGFILWLMTFGHRRQSDTYVWTALIAFAIEALYVYVSVFGSLLETSLFFFVGGVLTLLLALFLFNLHRHLDARPADEAR